MARGNSANLVLDFFIIIAIVALATMIAIYGHTNFLETTLLFFGLPSAYLVAKRPRFFRKTALGAFLLGGVWGFVFDYAAEFNRAWAWASNTSLVFPVQFFGVVSLDIMIWYVLWVFSIIAFYEYFIDHNSSPRLSRHFKEALIAGIAAVVVVVGTSKLAPALMTAHFAYAWLGALTLVPFLWIIIRRPSLIPKLFAVMPYFIFVFLSFEFTAIKQHLWSFPGHYLGEITFAGLQFPLEEFVFWVLISSVVAASYYEYCVDDDR